MVFVEFFIFEFRIQLHKSSESRPFLNFYKTAFSNFFAILLWLLRWVAVDHFGFISGGKGNFQPIVAENIDISGFRHRQSRTGFTA